MYFLQSCARYMSVYLRRGQITVPQQHLHHTQISTVVEQVGSEGVAQGMRRKGLADSGDPGLVLDAMPERLAGHLLTAQTREQHVTGPSVQQLPPGITQVAFDPDNRQIGRAHV